MGDLSEWRHFAVGAEPLVERSHTFAPSFTKVSLEAGAPPHCVNALTEANQCTRLSAATLSSSQCQQIRGSTPVVTKRRWRVMVSFADTMETFYVSHLFTRNNVKPHLPTKESQEKKNPNNAANTRSPHIYS